MELVHMPNLIGSQSIALIVVLVLGSIIFDDLRKYHDPARNPECSWFE